MKINKLFAMVAMAISPLCVFADEIPYDINALYLIGEASPAGWDRGVAPELLDDGSGVFSWTGRLGIGQFKFTTSRDSWNAIVSSVQDNETMVLDQPMGITYNPEAGGTQDWKWYNNEAGAYTLAVNLAEATLTVTRYPIPELYIIGGALSSWDRATVPALTSDSNGSFTWTGEMLAGDFKFILSRDSWNSVVATGADQPVELDKSVNVGLNFEGGSSDFKWKIAEAGKYTVKVNVTDMTMVVTKAVESAIGSVEADADTDAVYYTLTGVKTEHPVSGVYIRVAGGVASKVKF